MTANTTTRITVGQTWEITAGYAGGRLRLQIVAVGPKDVDVVTIPSGRKARMSLITLERRHRGARLILEADGSVPIEVPSISTPRKPVEKTASDYLKPAKGPRGMRAGGLSPTQIKIEQLIASGQYTYAEIGRIVGCSGPSVARHKTAIEDRRSFEAMERMHVAD